MSQVSCTSCRNRRHTVDVLTVGTSPGTEIPSEVGMPDCRQAMNLSGERSASGCPAPRSRSLRHPCPDRSSLGVRSLRPSKRPDLQGGSTHATLNTQLRQLISSAVASAEEPPSQPAHTGHPEALSSISTTTAQAAAGRDPALQAKAWSTSRHPAPANHCG
jgi:hypothetical protein